MKLRSNVTIDLVSADGIKLVPATDKSSAPAATNESAPIVKDECNACRKLLKKIGHYRLLRHDLDGKVCSARIESYHHVFWTEFSAKHLVDATDI